MNKLLAVLATVVIVGSLLVTGFSLSFAFRRGHDAGQRIEQVNKDQNAALRTFICLFERTVLTQPPNPKQTPAQQKKQRAFVTGFFSQALKQIHAKPCQTKR